MCAHSGDDWVEIDVDEGGVLFLVGYGPDHLAGGAGEVAGVIVGGVGVAQEAGVTVKLPAHGAGLLGGHGAKAERASGAETRYALLILGGKMAVVGARAERCHLGVSFLGAWRGSVAGEAVIYAGWPKARASSVVAIDDPRLLVALGFYQGNTTVKYGHAADYADYYYGNAAAHGLVPPFVQLS